MTAGDTSYIRRGRDQGGAWAPFKVPQILFSVLRIGIEGQQLWRLAILQ